VTEQNPSWVAYYAVEAALDGATCCLNCAPTLELAWHDARLRLDHSQKAVKRPEEATGA